MPGVSVLGSQPCRAKPVGPFISMAHSALLPSAATFNTIQACGLVHWNSFTVPSSWTILRASNMANEWCAAAGIAEAATAAIPAKASVLYDMERLQAFYYLFLIVFPPVKAITQGRHEPVHRLSQMAAICNPTQAYG